MRQSQRVMRDLSQRRKTRMPSEEEQQIKPTKHTRQKSWGRNNPSERGLFVSRDYIQYIRGIIRGIMPSYHKGKGDHGNFR